MKPKNVSDDLRSEYDFDYSKGVRGKYKRILKQSANVAVLEPAAVFGGKNTLHFGPNHASCIVVPVIPPQR